MEDWSKTRCECGADNWVNYGDPTDETRADELGVICYKCSKKHSFCCDDDGCVGPEWDGIDDPDSYVLGLRTPE